MEESTLNAWQNYLSDTPTTPLKTQILSYQNLSNVPLMHPHNIPFYQHLKGLYDQIPAENVDEINRNFKILQSLIRYPLPLGGFDDFIRLNGMDEHTASILSKIDPNGDHSTLAEFKRHFLAEAEMFCKLLLTNDQQIRHQHLPLQSNPNKSQILSSTKSTNIIAKRFYTPKNGSSSWAALVILFLYHTCRNVKQLRLSEIVNLSKKLSKILPCAQVDSGSLSKLIKHKLVAFHNDFFTKGDAVASSNDKPKRFMTKMADMYYYSITQDGLHVARNLIIKVKFSIQSLIDNVLPPISPLYDRQMISTPNRSQPEQIIPEQHNCNGQLKPIHVIDASELDLLDDSDYKSVENADYQSDEFEGLTKNSTSGFNDKIDGSNILENMDLSDPTRKRFLNLQVEDCTILTDQSPLKLRKYEFEINKSPNLDESNHAFSPKEFNFMSDVEYELDDLSSSLLSAYRTSLNNDDGVDNDYHLVLVIDNREFGGSRSKYYDLLIDMLKNEGIRYHFYNLPLGDIIWVCHKHITDTIQIPGEKSKRDKTSPFENGETYVLGWIIERKTISDLHSSIIDGRYDDQRHRMLESGMKQIIYLYENCYENANSYSGGHWKKRVNPKTFASAKSNIQFINGFNVINTSSPSHTAALIVHFHRCIEHFISDVANISSFKNMSDTDNIMLKTWLMNPENSSPWDKWVMQTRKSSNVTYRHVFGKQLRCIPTCGPIATAAILSKWPKPYNLYSALSANSETLLNVHVGRKKLIGKKLIEHIVKLYTDSSLC